MSDGGERTCPLCAEEMDLTDQQLKPCKCGYEICVWCWHHIMDMAEKDDTEGRCPACRSPYDKEKIVSMTANCERLVSEMNMERKKSKAKTKTSEGRKQLSSVRVIQRNLVYIVGLPLDLADEDLLQRREYFGQYGKVLKVSMSRTAAGVIQQFPNNTCSVYITYSKEEDAIRCIQSVHGFVLDGRPLKACFGTTKYCHAWLRNAPCTNPDCLYLHEVGSQEDSFTKDEIISAYTRNRVQQITGAPNNMGRLAGSMLPPPLDDYCDNSSASAPKPIVKSASTVNAASTGKGSPPNGSSAKAGALPAAASWGMRSTSLPQVASSTYSNGPSKPKPETADSVIPLLPAVASTNQASAAHCDTGKKVNAESQRINGKVRLDVLKPGKLNNGTDFRPIALDKPATSDFTPAGDFTLATSSDQTPFSIGPKREWSKTMASDITNSNVHLRPSSDFEKEVVFENTIGELCSDSSSVKVNGDCDGESFRPSSSHSDHCAVKSPRSHGSQHILGEQYTEPQREKTCVLVNGICASTEQSDWKLEPETQAIGNSASELEDDVISFANQRLNDPEVVSHNSYLPSSGNSFHIPIHSRPHFFQQNEPSIAVSINPDSLFVDNRVVDRPHLYASSNSVKPNGYPDSLISSHTSSVSNLENSYLIPNGGERNHVGRLQCNDGNATMDGGESSIISNILSLDLDSWDDPLTSQQHLAKLLGDGEKKSGAFKISSPWKGQNNSQSRFSFARQEESRNQPFGVDMSFNAVGQLPRQQSFNQDILENRNSLLDKLGIGNGFSSGGCNESESFPSNPLFSSNKPPVSRTQFSAPPGFSVPNKAPPPGFSSHERVDQTFDSVSGNHLHESLSLPRNSYSTAQNGSNISGAGDIEFMDPAILAVGKGNNISRLQSGLNSPGLDMRSNFQQQLNAFEDEARLQLLMQRSLSSHQNLRYPDIGDNFSSLNGSYGISSRIMDQSQINNLSLYAQLSLQQARNGLVSNGHWDGWSEVQGGNNLGVAELLRNERLGFNKFYGGGYEEPKFRMPNSGSLYNRTFEM